MEFYRKACRKNVTNLLACSIKARDRKIKDMDALEEARQLGFKIEIPPPKPRSKNEYEIPLEDDTPSVIIQQLTNMKKKAAEAAAIKREEEERVAKAKAEADAALAKAQADADAKAAADSEVLKNKQDAAAKAAAEQAAKDIAAAQEEARLKAEREGLDKEAQEKAAAEAAAAAQKKAAEEAAAAEAAAQKEREEAAAKAAADKAAAEAAAKAAAEAKAQADAAAAEAAKPKITSKSTGLGKVLVAPNGMTLYVRNPSLNCKKGASLDQGKACADECDKASTCLDHWPILAPGPGLTTGLAGTIGKIERIDNKADQFTLDGQPLFFSIKDEKPGDTKGHNDGNGFVVALTN